MLLFGTELGYFPGDLCILYLILKHSLLLANETITSFLQCFCIANKSFVDPVELEFDE